MENYLLQLFRTCLSARYTEVENSGSFAWERQGDRLFIYFQHSHGLTDWIHNISFAAVPFRKMTPNWYCHAGFLRVWSSIKPYLDQVMEDPQIRHACVVGYSHGAALALFCYEHLWAHRPDLRQTLCGYGFGCPRVLYGCPPHAVTRRWDHFYRIENSDDLVTRLPPRVSGYCHVGPLVLIGESGKYTPLDAHRPENYLRELGALEL